MVTPERLRHRLSALLPVLSLAWTLAACAPSLAPTPNPTAQPKGITVVASTPTVARPAIATSEPAAWTIAETSEARTASGLGTGSPGGPGSVRYTFYPRSTDDVFLLVGFKLRAGSQAKALDARDVVLVADGSREFRPVGFTLGSEAYVGKLSGTLSREGADLDVEFDVVSALGHPGGGRGLKTNSLAQTFVYVVPREYVDGKHRFRLTIAGARGVDVAVKPLPLPQGHVALSADGNYLAVSRDKSLHLFERSKGAPLWSYRSSHPLRSARISADGSYVLAAAQQVGGQVKGRHTVMLFHRSKAEPLWSVEFSTFSTIALSADGRRAAVAGNKEPDPWGHYVYLFDVPSGKQVGRLGDRTGPTREAIFDVVDIALSADGQYVAAAGWDTLYLFNGATSSEIWRHSIKESDEHRRFESVAVSSEGDYVGAAYQTSRPSSQRWTYTYTVLLFQRGKSAPAWEYTSPTAGSPYLDRSVLLAADGGHLAVWGGRQLSLFSTADAAPRWLKEDLPGGISSVGLSSAGGLVAVGGGDGVVYLLDRSGNTLWSRPALGSSVGISQDGGTIAASSDTSVHLLEAAGGAAIWTHRFSEK